MAILLNLFFFSVSEPSCNKKGSGITFPQIMSCLYSSIVERWCCSASSTTGTFSSYAAMALKHTIVFCEINCLLLKMSFLRYKRWQWIIYLPILQYFKVPIDILFPDTQITFQWNFTPHFEIRYCHLISAHARRHFKVKINY